MRHRTLDGLQTDRRRYRSVLLLTALALVAFFVWAANARLDESTRGIGKVASLRRGQIIQSLEGGILTSLSVREGQKVAEGETLAKLDDTRFRTAFEDLKGQAISLQATLNRLHAERKELAQIPFDPEIAARRSVIKQERELFKARRRRLSEAIASLDKRIRLVEERLSLIRPLAKQGFYPKAQLIPLEKDLSELRGKRADVRNAYFQEISDEVAEKSAELSSIREKLKRQREALSRTTIKSPVRGIVKNLRITTRGGVIRPGETIMEIVPLGDKLYVEAKIRPRDVAFLRTGLPATVKITAYDYTVYGMLEGRLVFVSADTIQDENRSDQAPYYRVRVLTDKASLKGPNGPMPIKPGMIAEVSIQTGRKTVLQYLLKPLLRGQEAMSER